VFLFALARAQGENMSKSAASSGTKGGFHTVSSVNFTEDLLELALLKLYVLKRTLTLVRRILGYVVVPVIQTTAVHSAQFPNSMFLVSAFQLSHHQIYSLIIAIKNIPARGIEISIPYSTRQKNLR
jgi:hypothetical protein